LTNLGFNLSKLEDLCKIHNPSLIVACNVLGHPNDFNDILEICRKYDVILVEDNCESLGSMYNEKKLGSFGLMSSHSFYYGHHISTIEGGMVSTDDEEIYNLLLSMRSHGWNRDLTKNFIKKYSTNDSFRDMYTFFFPGLNVRSTDLNAFIGINQLKKIDIFSKKREENFLVYQNKLKDYWSQTSSSDLISSFAYGILVKDPKKLYEMLRKNKIESRPLICGNIARHPFWKDDNYDEFPNANIIHDYGIYLPNHSGLTSKNVEEISEYVCKYSEPIKI